MSILPHTEDSVARFWKMVDIEKGNGPHGDCWEWGGFRENDGYGRFWVGGKPARANRFALELSIGRHLSDDELACHKCDNPPCVRPSHLFVGSHLDNTQDAISKGRWPSSDVCINGHPLDTINLRISGGRRSCRACQRQNAARHRKRKKDNAVSE